MAADKPSTPPEASALGELSGAFENAPWAVTELSEAAHVVRYANAAFCALVERDRRDVIGQPFERLFPATEACLALLDRVYRTGIAESYTTPDTDTSYPLLFSYTLWPVKADGRTAGVIFQVSETGRLHEMRQAISQALLLGALRQHSKIEAAALANERLETEIVAHRQREADARMLANEIAHRVKNNLQIVAALVRNEGKRTPAPWNQGHRATHDRIMAIAQLYDLMSESGRGEFIDLRAYVAEIARSVEASLLGDASGVRIVADAEPHQIDARLAVPFGLLVNELCTNAVKHAFPEGQGMVTIATRTVGDDVELTVGDDGIGTPPAGHVAAPGRHGSDYVAIFVRQLGGTLSRSTVPGTGTTYTIRFRLPAGPAVPAA